MPNRILIVDNDNVILDMMKDALTQENYIINAVNSVSRIFEIIQEFKPELVLIDYILDDINGGEICHQIKNNPVTSSIPVIIISGHPRVLNSLGTYGSDAILEKPFDLTDLFEIVKKFLPTSIIG